MYLIERLVGLTVYVATLLFFCIILENKKNIKINKVLFIYTLVLSVIAFFFKPVSGNDLYRLNEIMDIYIQNNFNEIIEYAKNSTTPITVLYMYFIGKTGIIGLLPAITTFITYSNIFYVLKNSIKKYNLNNKRASIILFFLMSGGIFFETISGIRTLLAFSIIGRCIYDEFVENKKFFKNIILYVIACLIHPVAIALLIIRGVYFIIKTSKTLTIKVFNIVVVIIFFGILYKYGYVYVNSMIVKINEYVISGSFSYFWEYIIGILTMFVIIKIQIFYKKNLKRNNKNNINDLYKFSILLDFIIIIFSFEYNIYHRFILLNTIISIPIFVSAFAYIDDSSKKKQHINALNYVFYMNILILFLECARGNLTSLKFFIL